MKKIRKGFSFMLMFALVGMFALRTTSITASAGSTDSAMLESTLRNSPGTLSNETAAFPLVVVVAAAGGAVTAALVSEVLHHHFSINEFSENSTEVKPVLEEGDKLFDM